jgi:hypothetical protein
VLYHLLLFFVVVILFEVISRNYAFGVFEIGGLVETTLSRERFSMKGNVMVASENMFYQKEKYPFILKDVRPAK